MALCAVDGSMGIMMADIQKYTETITSKIEQTTSMVDESFQSGGNSLHNP